MRVTTSSAIKVFLGCLLFLLLVSVLNADDNTRFTLKDGVIFDLKLGLQWAQAPDRAMNYYQAKDYARDLSLAGGGWRLPTRAELKSLYDFSKPGGADPKFNVSEDWVWTSELEDPSDAWTFDFSNGGEGRVARNSSNRYGRVLAVRSRR
jgi:hypothetical protein